MPTRAQRSLDCTQLNLVMEKSPNTERRGNCGGLVTANPVLTEPGSSRKGRPLLADYDAYLRRSGHDSLTQCTYLLSAPIEIPRSTLRGRGLGRRCWDPSSVPGTVLCYGGCYILAILAILCNCPARLTYPRPSPGDAGGYKSVL
ncbi:hypothetical protein DFH06DRAFT_1482535 [Mycena polygramma]|nr:hypothetical protein DFH06DRAFT_1482535 [Mycena polygramma]